jgi:hypothetical protein
VGVDCNTRRRCGWARSLAAVLSAAALAGLGASFAVPRAFAGTYLVRACWSTSAIGALGWQPVIEDPSDSPPGSNAAFSNYDCGRPDLNGFPLIAQVGTAWSPLGSKVGWRFSAPAQAAIVGFEADVAASEGANVGVPDAWTAELWDQNGARLGLFPPGVGPVHPFAVRGFAASHVGFGLACRALACRPPVDGVEAALAVRIIVTVRDDAAPSLSIDQAPPASWQRLRSNEVAVHAGDNVGVSALELLADGHRLAGGDRNCYTGSINGAPRPCPGEPALASTVDLDGMTDGRHELVARATDVAGNVAERTFELLIDHEPPGAPQNARLSSADGWRSTNAFAVAWTNPPSRGGGPIARAMFWICPADDEARARSGCVRGERVGDEIAGLDDLVVPGDGTWQVRIAVADAAGNFDEGNSAVAGHLRLDTQRPSAVLIPPDPSDPTRISVRATDAISGVARVEIEARRRGDRSWTVLDVGRTGQTFAAVADDDVMPAGTYEFRARAIDQAGNEFTTTTISDGSPLAVELPARERSRMTVTRRGHRPRSVGRVSLRYRQSIALAGRLSDSTGKPRASSPIAVLERVGDHGAPWRALTTLRTSRHGTFVFRPASGPARTLRFRYAGDPTTRSAAVDVELAVRAGATLAANRAGVRNGASVTFRGRLLGGPLPAAGKLVVMQALTTRGWRTFATARAKGRRGRWSYRYRFTGTRITTRYAFRAVVPEEASYPFKRGVSAVEYVRVRAG